MKLALTIPGVPVPCQRARVYVDPRTGRSRGFTPDKTRSYEELVRWYAQVAAQRAKWKPPPGALFEFTARFYRARNAGDLDNFAKAASDALRGVAWPDDRHVTRMVLEMGLDRGNPRTEIEVRVLSNHA